MLEEKKKKPNVEEIPIIREFSDVFPEEIPELPSKRDIKLMPGTSPISKAPYKMAPAEMKELKEQL